MTSAIHTVAALRLADRLVLYRTRSRQCHVFHTEHQPIEHLRAAIARICPHGGRGLTTWLTHPHLCVRHLTIPFDDRNDITAILPELLQQEWPTEESYVWTIYPLHQHDRQTTLLVAGLSETNWETWLQRWHQLGIDPDSVQLLGLSTWDAWTKDQQDQPIPRAMLHLEPEGGMLVHGIARTIRGAYPIAPLPDDAPCRNAWVQHISRILSEIVARDGDPSRPTVLGLCGSAIPDNLPDTLTNACGIPTQLIFPFSQDTPWPPLTHLLAPASLECEFRTGAHVSSATAAAQRRRRRLAAASITTLVIAVIAALGTMVWTRIATYTALTDRVAELTQTILPGQHPANPVEQAHAALQTERRQLARLRQPAWKPTDSLRTITAILPPDIPLTIKELTISPTVILIDGTVPSFAALDTLRTTMQRYPDAGHVTVTNTSDPQATLVAFRLTVPLRPRSTSSEAQP
jgi:hypothetical protein